MWENKSFSLGQMTGKMTVWLQNLILTGFLLCLSAVTNPQYHFRQMGAEVR